MTARCETYSGGPGFTYQCEYEKGHRGPHEMVAYHVYYCGACRQWRTHSEGCPHRAPNTSQSA